MPSPTILRNVIQAKMPPGSGQPPPNSGTDVSKTALGTSDSESHPDLLLEHAPVALAMFDEEMRYLVANRMWVEEFGLQQVKPLLGQSQYEVFPSLHPGWKQVYERALQGHVVRSEHDALSGQKGESIVYRWEVRPWRRKADASVGGLMVSCEKYPGTPKIEKIPEDSEIKDTHKARPSSGNDAVGAGLFASHIPILVLDDTGRIQRANVAALGPVLSKGIQEGVTFFWSAYGDGEDSAGLRDQTLAAIHEVVTSSEPVTKIIRVRRVVPGHPAAEGISPLPSQWMLTRPAGGTSNQIYAVALGVHPRSGDGLASTLDEHALTEELNRVRQEAAVLREVEAAFAKREARQRAVLDSLACGLVILNERGVPIHHNEHIAKLLGRGLQPGENVENWLLSACPTDDHKKMVSAVWSNDIWRRQLTRVMSLATADGLLKELEFRPVSLAGGGLLISIHDVTDTCRMEEQLRSTEAKFRALLNETPVGVVLIDKNGSIFEANPAAERIMHRSKAELRRLNSENWLSPESVTKRREGLRLMRDEGRRSACLDAVVLQPDGVERAVNLRIALVPDATGAVHTAIHFLQPIEASQAESHIKAPVFVTPAISETPLISQEPEAASRVSIVWLLQTDGSGRITQWTDEAVARFGFIASEAQGQWLHGLFRPSDPTGFYADVQARVALPDEAFDWTYFGKGGARGSGRFFAKATAEGGNSIDLFEERVTEIERPLPSLSNGPPLSPGTHLVRPVSQWPVADLDREKLLLSETHHRIKNHLQIISSMLNLQMNTLVDQPARDVLRSSQNRVRSIAALHQHLYQLVLDEGPDFADFAQGLTERLRECYDVSAEQVGLTLDISPGVIDHEWMMPLALILNETLSNALEHAFPSGRNGTISVRLTLNDGTGEFVVSDDGIGLPETFDSTTASGLGLKILGVFAEQMRGELRLTGAPNQGTQFNLRFPMAHVDN